MVFMVWATVSSRSCFCWLYRASPSLAAKNIISLISVLAIWLCPCVESSLCCWKRVFAMSSSISLCPASFYTPRPNFLYIHTNVKCIHGIRKEIEGNDEAYWKNINKILPSSYILSYLRISNAKVHFQVQLSFPQTQISTFDDICIFIKLMWSIETKEISSINWIWYSVMYLQIFSYTFLLKVSVGKQRWKWHIMQVICL